MLVQVIYLIHLRERTVQMMPLVMGDSGQAYEIKRIGGNDEVRTHLASMGFVPGAKVTLVSVNNESVIVNVKNVRVGISDVLARRIMI